MTSWKVLQNVNTCMKYNQFLSPLTLWVQIPLRRGVLYTTLCDKICQWFSPGTPVSSTNKVDRHDITEMLFKVALNTINLNQTDGVLLFHNWYYSVHIYVVLYNCPKIVSKWYRVHLAMSRLDLNHRVDRQWINWHVFTSADLHFIITFYSASNT
jgi:hypothetical protein